MSAERTLLSIPDLSYPVAETARRNVAVVGGDVGALLVAAVLLRRGHRVTWFRGAASNPRAGSAVIKSFAVEPLALPGFVLALPAMLLRTAIRGGIEGAFKGDFITWLLSAAAAGRPLSVEAIAADRARLLGAAEAAFARLAPDRLKPIDVLYLYRDARDYAYGWAVHDVRRRRGVTAENVSFADIDRMCPQLSRRYGRGMKLAAQAIDRPDDLIDSLKAEVERHGEMARRWPERIHVSDTREVEILDRGRARHFDWAIRCEDAGPDEIWPRGCGTLGACLPYRERIVVRETAPAEAEPDDCRMAFVDGASGAWLERLAPRVVAAGAHRIGGEPGQDLPYLIAASYVRIWRELAAEGWNEEGSRVETLQGWLAPDSRPLLGPVAAGSPILMSAAYGELDFTLGAAAGFGLAAFIEENAAETEKLAAFAPTRFA